MDAKRTLPARAGGDRQLAAARHRQLKLKCPRAREIEPQRDAGRHQGVGGLYQKTFLSCGRVVTPHFHERAVHR